MSITQLINYFSHWVINVGLVVLKLKNRDTNIWLFGAWRGKTYSDNSKYFFDYVCKHHPEIQAVWITKNKAVKTQLRSEGKMCYLSHEKAARKLRLRAGYLFFTNGAHDVGTFDLTRGAYKVALWHGMPLKRIFFANNYFRNRSNNINRLLQYYVLKLYNKAGRDLSIATSETAKRFLIESFEIPANAVAITGQPRNDVLSAPDIVSCLKKQLGHAAEEQFILFMPTWRDSGHYDDFFTGEATYLDQIITALSRDEAFLETLEKEGIKFYVKPHPNRTIKAKAKGNIMVLKPELHLDTQEVMAAADVLITDYSSAFIDYALTDRPIHFYVPDLEEYAQSSTGLFLNFNDFASYWFKDLSQLKLAILNRPKQRQLGQLNTVKINTIYDDTSLKRGSYSQNVFEAVQHHKK